MSYSDIAERYRHIKPHLEKFRRSFTVLDLGAYEGAFSFQIASDFPHSTVVAVEKDPIIVSNAHAHGLSNVIVLNREISSNDISDLSACEHFDVILCLNFLHHQGSLWYSILSDLKWMCGGGTIYVQTPKADDFNASGQGVVQDIGRHFAHYAPLAETVQFTGHMPRPIYRLYPLIHRPTITQACVTSPEVSLSANVYSSWDEKKIELKHKNEPPKPWIYGFNLANFCALGGAYPTKERVIEILRAMPLPAKQHGDIALHNIIINSGGAHLIDGGEPWATWDDRTNLDKVIREVEEKIAAS